MFQNNLLIIFGLIVLLIAFGCSLNVLFFRYPKIDKYEIYPNYSLNNCPKIGGGDLWDKTLTKGCVTQIEKSNPVGLLYFNSTIDKAKFVDVSSRKSMY